MKITLRSGCWLLALPLLAWLCVCALPGKAVAALAKVQIPVDEELYESAPEPLTAPECGQCHSTQYKALQEKGGLHRFACQNCHTKFHAYNPSKGNYAELMPRCEQCHEPPHGAAFTDCLSCHTNPHSPRVVPMDAHLEGLCGQCHTKQAEELQAFPSKHTEQGCPTCHYKHGLIPSCMDCHEPHTEGQTFEECVSCHSVHKPLEIELSESAPASTCGTCHPDVYATWTATKSKHGQVNCSRCHTVHGQVPECQHCHGLPHGEAIMQKFPRCLDCHLNAHDPPVKQ